MKIDELATYERAKRLANLAVWTVDLQHRRLNSIEPEDHKFPLRRWADFQFLIIALTRLRRSAELATKITAIKTNIKKAISEFDTALPAIKKMRNVAEHIDEYAIDNGHDKNISRKELEVANFDGKTWHWLGFQLNSQKALIASDKLFKALKRSQSLLKIKSNKSIQRTLFAPE